MEKQEIVALLNTVAIPTYQIEANLGMPKTTLQKVLSGQRKRLPKKWALKLLEVYRKVDENNSPKNKEMIEKKRNTVSEVSKSAQYPLTPNEAKHPLYKEGDPKEGSMAFYMKYDCYTYDERK